MKLYHGTSGHIGRLSILEGLKSRRSSKTKGNWEKAPSRHDAVYMSVAYAPYFAMMTENHCTEIAIVEIDSDHLFESLLVPDEDAIEQSNMMSKTPDDLPKTWDMIKRTAHYRKNLHKYDGGQWKDSINLLGNCAYMANVPVKAITQVALLDVKNHKEWARMCVDPTISILNYKFLQDKYKLLTQLPFNYPVPPETDEEKFIREQLIAQNPQMATMYRNVFDVARDFDHSKVIVVNNS